ncbi:protocadherin-11 X-linked [Dromiciops gliroides]|uniref:protocadherin-11 X-linked n=1 Tax=Dromiciops gliroides TaxID=33562 RepID=UPI001CC37E75|nr:protocadherin-11 X-linked [Dromiciops gliroides]
MEKPKQPSCIVAIFGETQSRLNVSFFSALFFVFFLRTVISITGMDLLSGTCMFALLLACVVFQSGAQEKNYTIREELPENVLIGDLVKDLNLTFTPGKKLSTPLQFKLVYKSGDQPLVRVEETTGEIYTTGVRIDREKLCSGIFIETRCFYEVEVAVLPDEIFKLVKIRFLIEDVNDNAPLFPATVINISIPENTAINSRYPIPSAIDPDVGINGIQQYHLIKGLGIFGLDVIETPEGEKWPQLIVQKALDREERDTYVMKLKVEDGGSPPRSSTAILQVSVIDMNDNRPIFRETEVEVSIPENAPVGSSVYQLRATDADVGANARIQYFFSNLMNQLARKLFSLNNTTGLITIKEPLDREQAPLHKLMVVATDGGPMPARAMVIVNVTDVNDNLPIIDVRYIIDTTNGTVVLSENAGLNTKIALVTLIDKDADRNGRVTCFTENDVPFRLRPVFDNQFLMETSSFLDYENTKEYEVKLWASDAGKPPLNYSTSVIIKVRDENDNAPIFSQSSIGVSVLENNAPGAQLTKISATDADTGKNGEITYLIAGEPPSAFRLDNRTGILTAVEQLDREKKDKYTFTVTARDNGEPHLQSNATVTVTVLDQNDNNPTFTHSEYNFYVPENLPKHGTVGLITVTDPDSGENGAITLTVLNNNGSFIVDSKNGVIRPNMSFDREKQGSYTFTVMATDGGRVPRSSSAKVSINVVDVNNNKPVLISPSSNYTFEFIPLATEIGTLLYVVMGIDANSSTNPEIRHQSEERNKKKSFEAEGTSGNITLKSRFIPTDQNLHKLLIKARDLGQPDSVNSKILLNLFVNDSTNNSSLIDELLRKTRGKPVTQNVEKTDVGSTSSSDYVKYIIAIISGSMTAVLTIVIAAILRCRRFPRFRAARKQNSEWVTPNPGNSETITISTNDNSGTNNVILNLVTLGESRTDDPDNEEELTTSLDVVIDMEEDSMERYNWGTRSSTFKPDGPDLAQHYKATSPQPAFHIEPETPVHSKHHAIQELPVDNTFVMGCDSISKCSSSSSDPYSISDCSCQGTIKTTATIHPRQAAGELGITDSALKDPNVIAIRTYPLHLLPATRARTPLREPPIQETAVDIWTSSQRKPEPKKPGKAQRRVTFHLPESSQESGSDIGPIEVEAGAAVITRPGYARREYYEHSSTHTHSNRTEGDGNSDPETACINGLRRAAEITIQPTLEEVSDNCTQECLTLGHSDSCWMPAAVPQYQQPPSPEPAVIRHSPPASNLITTTVMCHNPPEPQAAAICTSPPRALSQEMGHGARSEARGAQGRVVVQDDSNQGRRCSPRALFCTAEHDDSIKVIPMMTFTPGQSSRGSPNIEEDPM